MPYFPTQTAATRAHYRARAVKLQRTLNAHTPLALTTAFLKCDALWKPATVRQYRAAIKQSILDSDYPSAEKEFLIAALKFGPRPIKKRNPPRTSARKRKSLTHQEYRALVEALLKIEHPDSRLAAEFLRHNCNLYLRPCEWETARLVGRRLVIKNAKATNGRSFGEFRHIQIPQYTDDDRASLQALIATLTARSRELGSFKRLWPRLASRIARACKTAGIKRVALYTSRHVGMASAKAVLTPEELAATAGHKSTATAQLHYAHPRTAWGPETRCVPRPASADLKRISRSPKTDWIITKERLRQNPSIKTQIDAAVKREHPRPNQILVRGVNTSEPLALTSPISKQARDSKGSVVDLKCEAVAAILPPTPDEVYAGHDPTPAEEPTDVVNSEDSSVTDISDDSAAEDAPRFGR